MILKEITLSNYKSYYNKCNIKFSEGLNLISGHVGAGKSNLFDAFQWLLYNKTDGKELKDIANQKKLYEIESNNSSESIECFVSVVFNNKKIDYTVKRYYSLTFRTNNWVIDNEDYSIQFEDPITSDFKLFSTSQGNNYKIEHEINKLLPTSISKYIWFQGETLEKLIDFTNPKTLENAVDFISYLNVYSKMEEISLDTLNLIEKKLHNKHNAETRESNKFKKAEFEKKKAEIGIGSCSTKIKELKEELKKLNQREKKCNDQLSILADFPDLLVKETNINNQLNEIRGKRFTHYDDLKIQYINKWILKGCDPLIAEGLTFFEKFNEKKQSLITENNKQLQEGIPGDKLINKMLNEHVCLICLRDAPEGSDAYKNIERNLDKNKEIKILDPEIQSQSEIIASFGSFPNKIHKIINNIEEEINKSYDKEEELQKSENELNDALNSVKDEIKALEAEKGSILKNLNSKLISSERESIQSQQKTKRNQIKHYEIDLTRYKNIFLAQKKILDNLLPKSIKYPEKDAVKYLQYINELIESRTKEEKIELINKIEETTNKIQKTIVEKHKEKIIVLYAKIDENDFSLSFVDKDGNPTPGHGAQKALVKMSIISAILKLSNDYKEQSFPFITDAPASDFDLEMTIPFLESVSRNFNQSIVILKDVKDQLLTLKKENYISSIKKITLLSPENKSASMSNSYTNIENI